MFLLIVSKMVEIIMKNRFNKDYFTDDKSFLDLSSYLDLEKINTYCIAASCFFFPFRILSYLAHYEYFSPAKTVMNTITRTAPGVIIYTIIATIISLGWACCFYISLNHMFPEFSTF
jgi:hypothetical protein